MGVPGGALAHRGGAKDRHCADHEEAITDSPLFLPGISRAGVGEPGLTARASAGLERGSGRSACDYVRACVCERVCVCIELHPMASKTRINGVIILKTFRFICVELLSIIIALAPGLGYQQDIKHDF